MRKSFETALLIFILVACAGLTIGLTYAPCYSSLCSEEFYPYETRIHIAFYYALLASMGVALYLRAQNPTARRISEAYLWPNDVPILKKRISVGGIAMSIWIVGLTLATTAFWLDTMEFWRERADPIGWVDAKIRLLVTCIVGHHVDIILGLVIIPVSRNSILGRVFNLHTSTLLYAHKLLAYLLVVGSAAHGAAYFAFVATYRVQDDATKERFEIDNPTLTHAEADERGAWWKVTLPSGMLAFLAMLIIVITALPVLRRQSYNTFYYLHVIFSVLIVVLLCFHASTNFYFLLPGLLLWIGDWAWRIFRGMGGLRKCVSGKLENAGDGWYRISLPASAKLLSLTDDVETAVTEKNMPTHPLQTYFLVFPTISKLQNHAFTAAKVGSLESGPTFLFQRATGKKQKKLEKEWTWKLGASVNNLPNAARDLEVRVEGPYIPSVPAMFSASKIVCIVGGTGLTGAYSIALWWLKYRSQIEGSSLTLAWTVRHRETANVREWQELEEAVVNNPKIKLLVQVSSEQGRLNADQVLRTCLNSTNGGHGQGEQAQSWCDDAWIYLSGPEGLLSAGEMACVDLQREVRRGTTTVDVRRLDFYAAKWEV